MNLAKLLELAGSALNLNALAGWRTKIAAVGLAALGVYQVTQGQYEAGLQSIAAGLAALGIREAVKSVSKPTDPPAAPAVA